MTQPAPQPPAGPPPQPTTPPAGQVGQQPPPAAPPASPAQPPPSAPQPQPYGSPPQTPPQQPPTPPQGWTPPPTGWQGSPFPEWQPPPGQPPAPPYTPAPTGQPPAPSDPGPPQPLSPPPAGQPDNDGGGYDLSRLPKAAREEIERLRSQMSERDTQLRTATVSQHAGTAAGQAGVNPAALLGSTAWQQAAAGLDPAAPDYAQRLAWTIQTIAAQNPWMAAQPAGPPQPQLPARSGGHFGGAPTATTMSLDEQIAEAQKAGNWRKVISLQNQKLTAAHQQQPQ